jgi:transcriptional regulator with XRE-family HTH domain
MAKKQRIVRRKEMKSLKELREHNNLKQREVAQHIGVSDRVYSYYEKGRTLPAKYVKPLANLFGISCDELLENNTEALDWEKEFGCIERTERLVLPTWEEIERDFIINKQNAGNYCVVEFWGSQEYSLDIVVYNGDAMITISDDDFYEPLTKENYTLVCRKAKELFLGEKND